MIKLFAVYTLDNKKVVEFQSYSAALIYVEENKPKCLIIKSKQ